MNKKCEKCKYKLILEEQLCFFLGITTTSQLVQDECEQYMDLEHSLKGLIEAEEYFLKNDLDSYDNEECLCCKNKLRVEGSRKYFEEMLLVVNKRWESPEWKSYIHDKLIDEFGSFWVGEDIIEKM